MSRIHVVIKYDKLGLEERRKIWQQFFDKLEEERDDFVIASRAKDYVLEDEMISKVEWNGREIRNSRYIHRPAHARLQINASTYQTPNTDRDTPKQSFRQQLRWQSIVSRRTLPRAARRWRRRTSSRSA